MGIKLKQFLFVLDRAPVFTLGEVVTGSLLISLDGQLDTSQVLIKLKGVANCSWSESSGTGDDAKTDTYSAKEVLLDLPYIPGQVYPTVMTGGEHRFQFAFQLLDKYLPSSFEGPCGSIRYKLKARIHTPSGSLDKRAEVPITINCPSPTPLRSLTQGVDNTTSKTIGILTEKTITLSCHLDRIGHNIGSNIPVMCSVDNQTKKTMDIRATLKQVITYRAQGRHTLTRNKLVVAYGSPIQPKSDRKEVISLLVPPTAELTSEMCKIIKLTYTIVVTVVIPGHFDLHCELPVVLVNEGYPFEESLLQFTDSSVPELINSYKLYT